MPSIKKQKRIKRPQYWTKSAYARRIGKSPTHVNNLIEAGELAVVECVGAQLVVMTKEVFKATEPISVNA